MFELDAHDVEYMREKIRYGYSVIKKIKEKINYGQITPDKADVDSVCYCSLNKGKYFSGTHCPYCHNRLSFIIPKEVEESSKESLNYYKKNSDYLYYIKEKENGLLIYKMELTESKIKKATDSVKENIKIINVVDFTIGGKTVAYKCTKKGFEETDLFNTLRINTKTLKTTRDIHFVYKDSVGLIDFLLRNKEIAKKTGLIEIINLLDINIPRDMILFTYIYFLYEYPAIELLIKMGHLELVSGLFEVIQGKINKETIRHTIKRFKTLIIDTKEGSKALAMPKFAADVLKETGADWLAYEAWAMAFSYQELSKEQFMECYTHPITAQLNPYELTQAFELIKYGYKLQSLLNYFQKSNIYNNRSIGFLKDYLEMAQLMGVKPDLYPKNYEAAHDNMMLAYKAKENEYADKVLHTLHINSVDCIPEDEEYTIVMPDSVRDLVTEGRNQRNCVASYVGQIQRKNSIIFFVRKKEDIDESYITAEYDVRIKKLYQIKYRFNNEVYNKDEIKYAEKFCENLKKKGDKIYEGAKTL